MVPSDTKKVSPPGDSEDSPAPTNTFHGVGDY